MVKLIFTGDFCPAFKNKNIIRDNSYSWLFTDFTDSIIDKDLHITNLECPITNSTDKILKDGPSIKADPQMIEVVKHAQVDIACLANNHIMDFGVKGLMDTIDLCNKIGIKTVGAGKNLCEASNPLYFSIKNETIAIINITQNEFSAATTDKPGANPLNIVQNYYSIREAKKNSNIVIVIVHGGNEEYSLPSKRIVDTFHFFADIGASAVISHHSHCLSGFEVYNNVPIFYGLGNFIFEPPFQNVSDKWFTGVMLLITINSKGPVKFDFMPFYQLKEGSGLKVLKDSDKIEVMEEINLYSNIIKNRSELLKRWNEYSEKSKHYYYTQLLGLSRIKRKLFRFQILQKLIFPLKRKIVLYDMIKCEAHSEVILDLLSDEITMSKQSYK